MDRTRRITVALLVVSLAAAACGSRDTSPSPSTGPSGTPAATPLAPSASPSPAASPSGAAGDPFLGAVAKTVSGDLRMRSQPRVSDDSVKYEPLLPLGTELEVVGGPVEASGYTWYQVEPLTFALAGGVGRGWVASADHDGTPWIGVAEPPIAGLDVASSAVARDPADPKGARSRRDLGRRVRHRHVSPAAGRPGARPARPKHGLLAGQHRAGPRHGPGRRQGHDRVADRRGPPFEHARTRSCPAWDRCSS